MDQKLDPNKDAQNPKPEEDVKINFKNVGGKKFAGKTKTFLIAFGLLLIISGAFLTAYLLKPQSADVGPDNQPADINDLFSGFSKLVIDGSNAADNFDFRPEKSDSLGVQTDSLYILKSKEALETEEIKDNLKFVPALEYDLEKVSDREWKIIPKEPIEPNTIVKAALSATYFDDKGEEKARDYTWAYQVKDSFKVLHGIPRDGGSGVPANTGIEFTFSHENFHDYERYFEIAPAAEGSFEKHGRTLVFVPKKPLQLGTVYTVRIKAGLPLRDSIETLGEDYAVTFETDPADQNDPLYFGFRNYVINASSKEPPFFNLYMGKKGEAEFKAEIFLFKNENGYLDSLAARYRKNPWWSYACENHLENTAGLSRFGEYRIRTQTHEDSTYLELPEAMPKGYYLVEFSLGEKKKQVWLQVSELTAYMNVTKTDTLVWVNYLSGAGPAGGAVIEIPETGVRATAGPDGTAVFATPEFLAADEKNRKENKIYYVKITRGQDSLIMPATKNTPAYWDGYWGSYFDKNDDYWSYLYTDRPRYQTDDTIKFFGLLKDRSGKETAGPVKISLYKEGYVDYYYRPVKILEKEISLSRDDLFDGEFALKNLRPDYYTLELTAAGKVVKRKYISIRPYIKPAYELSLAPEKNLAFAGETVKVKAKAAFFEGTPVPGLRLVYRTPDGEKKVVTDEKGEVNLEFTRAYSDCREKYGCWPDHEYLYIAPEDGEAAEIQAYSYITYYGPDTNLQTEITYPQKGKAKVEFFTNKIEFKKGEDGKFEYYGEKPAPNARAEGQVVRIKYTQVETGTSYDFITKKTYKTYRYDRSEQPADSISFNTGADGKYVYERDIEENTSYEIRLKVYGGNGRYENSVIYLYYYNGSYFYRYGNDWDYFHLEKTDESQSYKPGDKTGVVFLKGEEPLPAGRDKFLFIQLQNGLQEYKIQDGAVYEFEFEPRDIPNVNVEGVYFDGRNFAKSRTGRWGFVSLDYDTEEKELDLLFKTDKQSYRPGENVKLEIEVKDKNGLPKKASVNLNLVDEAYYAVAEDFASPLGAIYSPVAAGSLFINEIKTETPASKDMAEAEGGGCFAAGTLITMSDGSRKPIENIKAKDRIMTFTDPAEMKKTAGEVAEVFRHLVFGYLVINEELKVTPEHPIFSNGRFTDAGLLKPGDWLLGQEGERVTVRSIRRVSEPVEVYNFRVEPQNTYFADGFYVHNQEKGGGAREVFTDAALFLTVETDETGRASTEFKLPDNITSWRVTSQAISKDLYVGADVAEIPVSLPVFADVNAGGEYLLSDKPIAKFRAFGTALSNADPVEFHVVSESLGIDSDKIGGRAYQPAYFQFPELKTGLHSVTYGLETTKGNDAIKLPLSVISSRLEAQEAIEMLLTPETRLSPVNGQPIVLVFSDKGRNHLYRHLQDLAWSWGDRVDQSYTGYLSKKLLNKYYEEEHETGGFNAANYQLPDGGIALLPYSGSELELSARIAGINGDFDANSLIQYFFKVLENRKSNSEEITYALYGLAELGEPVLPRIQSWLGKEDLSPEERLYMAQAVYDLGAGEWSRSIYDSVMSEYAEAKDPYVAIRVEGKPDEVFRATMIAAAAASSLRAAEAEGLWKYVEDNQKLWGKEKNSENLFNIEKYKYVANTLPQLKPGPAEVKYEIDGQRYEAVLTGGGIQAISIRPEEAEKVKFLSITGDVGLSVRTVKPFDPAKAERDPEIGIRREYYVRGVKAVNFKENDMIEVRLYPEFGSKAVAGSYQITDILPSGLMAVTSYRYENYGNCYRYPYNTDGQMVKYRVNRDWKNYNCGNYIYYTARVRTRGEYAAEPAIIQSFINPKLINFSESGKITID